MAVCDEDSFDVELEGDHDLIIASRDFERLADACKKSGFIQGVEAGKEEGLRQGFSSGFASGLAIATPWALLRGQIHSLILHHGRLGGGVAGDTPPTTPVLTELQELLGSVRAEEVRWRESKIALERQAYHAELNKPTTPSELSHERGGDIAMETDEPAVVRGGSQVRYQDVAENADVPQIVHTFKERLEAITAMKKL